MDEFRPYSVLFVSAVISIIYFAAPLLFPRSKEKSRLPVIVRAAVIIGLYAAARWALYMDDLTTWGEVW